jgi:flagellar biosynthesis chaperone FliJ
LRALERSRSVALEEARTLAAARATELAEKEATREELARAREAAYEARRRQVAGNGTFTIQQLRWNHQYAVSQLALEQAARAVCEVARTALRQAQEDTARRLEELRVVEKLRARREAEAHRLSGRRDQERLDELGLIKSWRKTS